jgi:hypothetical protein
VNYIHKKNKQTQQIIQGVKHKTHGYTSCKNRFRAQIAVNKRREKNTFLSKQIEKFTCFNCAYTVLRVQKNKHSKNGDFMFEVMTANDAD